MPYAVDFAYLESYTGGDPQIVAEVLALFQQQAQGWLAGLERPDAGWHDLNHMIKGSAKGIGAQGLGELAGQAELGDPSMGPQVRAALAEVLAEIEGYLSRRGG